MKRSALAAVLVTLAAVSQGTAVIVAQYQFPNTASQALSADADASSSASAMTFSGNLTAQPPGFTGTYSSVQAGFSTAGNAFFRSSSLTTSESGAVAGNDYFSFALTPTSGGLTFTSLTFDLGGNLAGSPAVAPFTSFAFVRTSLDGFASNVGSVESFDATTAASAFANKTVNFSGALFQNVTQPVEFRVYIYSSIDGFNQTANDSIVRLDNVELSAIPEPSAWILSLAGAVGLLGLRRRA